MRASASTTTLRIRPEQGQPPARRRAGTMSGLLGSSSLSSFSENFEASVAEPVSKAHAVLRLAFTGAGEAALRDELDSVPIGYLDADAMDIRDEDGMSALHWCG